MFTTLPYFDHHTQHPPPSISRPSHPQPPFHYNHHFPVLVLLLYPPQSPHTIPLTQDRTTGAVLNASYSLGFIPSPPSWRCLRRRLLYDLGCGGCVVTRSYAFPTSPTCLRALIRTGENGILAGRAERRPQLPRGRWWKRAAVSPSVASFRSGVVRKGG